MNRRIIIGLVILMGISLLGIVAVQFYWFSNSVKVRNELFDRSVNEALNKAVRRLETGHDLKIIRNFTTGDSLKWDESIPPPPPPPLPGAVNIDVVVKRDSINGNITVITSKKNSSRSGHNSLKVHAIDRKSLNQFRIRQNSKDTLITLNDSLILSQFPKIPFNTGKKIEQLEKLSKQIAIEYWGWESGRHINEKQLRKILSEELMDRAIPISFNYEIHSEDSTKRGNTKTPDFTRWYRVNLFPDDILRKNLELAISFPDRDLFVGSSTTPSAWPLGHIHIDYFSHLLVKHTPHYQTEKNI